jgi:hypothetical protein
MTAPTPVLPLKSPWDALTYGNDTGLHPITLVPISRSQFASDADTQALTDHINYIAATQGASAAAAMLTSVQTWLAAGNSTLMPPRAGGVLPAGSGG